MSDAVQIPVTGVAQAGRDRVRVMTGLTTHAGRPYLCGPALTCASRQPGDARGAVPAHRARCRSARRGRGRCAPGEPMPPRGNRAGLPGGAGPIRTSPTSTSLASRSGALVPPRARRPRRQISVGLPVVASGYCGIRRLGDADRDGVVVVPAVEWLTSRPVWPRSARSEETTRERLAAGERLADINGFRAASPRPARTQPDRATLTPDNAAFAGKPRALRRRAGRLAACCCSCRRLMARPDAGLRDQTSDASGFRDVAAGFRAARGAQPLIEAASFHVGPGDKIGLVGRNGQARPRWPGCWPVRPARSGTAADGTIGYLPQDSRAADPAARPWTGCRPHAAGRSAAAMRTAEQQMADRTRPAATRAVLRQRRGAAAGPGGYAAEAEAASIAASLGPPAGSRPSRCRRCRAGSGGGWNRPGSCSPARRPCCLDEPTNHLTPTPSPGSGSTGRPAAA